MPFDADIVRYLAMVVTLIEPMCSHRLKRRGKLASVDLKEHVEAMTNEELDHQRNSRIGP